MSEEKSISQYISNLINELAEGNSIGVMQWHKELYRIGKPALSLLCRNLIEIQKLDLRSKEKNAYIMQLAKVVHDIDEQTCKDITMVLVYNGLERTTIKCLTSLNEFTHEDREKEADAFAIKVFRKWHPIKRYYFIPYIKLERKAYRDMRKIIELRRILNKKQS